MTKNLVWLLLISPFYLTAQQGIHFVQHLTWPEILQKAQNENKYVFVDCYTTWCGPCKLMDKKVYINDSLGIFMDSNYISVRVQMDVTDDDNPDVKFWYTYAHAIHEEYHVGAYPTFLFFSPAGKVVYRETGAKNVKGFIALAKAALDPIQQYYTLLANYQKANRDYTLMPALANAAQKMGQDSLTEEVVRIYEQDYLAVLPDSQFLTKENIRFVHSYYYLLLPKSKIFQEYYHNRARIDSAMYPGFASIAINFVIYQNDIEPIVNEGIKKNIEPGWPQLKKFIAKRYDPQVAEKNVLLGRLDYYKTTKKWDRYSKYFMRQQEQNGIEKKQKSGMNELDLNNSAYEVFLHSRKKRELKRALSWVNRALALSSTPFPDAMDTKANLLYKLGRKQEGLILEQQAYIIAPKNKGIQANYEKIKSGLPTWEND